MTEQKKTRVTLSIAENFHLCQYLTANPPKAGESLRDVFMRAQVELAYGHMNEAHVKTRLDEFNLPLIPVTGPASSELARLEERFRDVGAAIEALNQFRGDFEQRLVRLESAIAAHKLAIQGIGRDNVGAMNALNGHKWDARA